MSNMSNIGSLGWSEYKESQSLMVKVTGWDCQLKVEGGNGPHKRNFSWEGLVSRPEKGFAGTEVLGEFELPSMFSRINVAEFYKDKETSSICGFLYLVRPVSLGVNLYVNEETYHELHRIFSSATASGDRGALWIEITVKHAHSNVPGFWQGGWHNEHLEISRWRVLAGASVNKKSTNNLLEWDS
jgi:hypothetical protein